MTVIEIKSGVKEPWFPEQLALYVAAPLNPEVTFVEEGHKYFHRGRPLTSVTTVLHKENPFYRPGSADRGHKVHKICALDGQGILDERSVDQAFDGYLAAWRAFVKAKVVRFLGFEEIVADLKIGYAGRRDVRAELDVKGFPGAILYLKPTGKYQLIPFSAEVMPTMIASAQRKVIEYNEKARYVIWG